MLLMKNIKIIFLSSPLDILENSLYLEIFQNFNYREWDSKAVRAFYKQKPTFFYFSKIVGDALT